MASIIQPDIASDELAIPRAVHAVQPYNARAAQYKIN